MSLGFDSISVVPNLSSSGGAEGNGFDIFWTIAGNDFSPTFQVSQGDTESGPWTDLLQTKTADMQLLNAIPQRLNAQPELTWFKVSVYDGATLKLSSWPVNARGPISRNEYLQYREILRRWRVFFNKSGQCLDGYLLRRKIYGTKCPDCLDPILESSPTTDCTTCFATGIVGGYFPAVAMKADWSGNSIPKTQNQTTKESEGPRQVARSGVRIEAYPEAKSEDVWVDKGTRIRYLIESMKPDRWVNSVTSQIIGVSKLPSHHPAYNVPIS